MKMTCLGNHKKPGRLHLANSRSTHDDLWISEAEYHRSNIKIGSRLPAWRFGLWAQLPAGCFGMFTLKTVTLSIGGKDSKPHFLLSLPLYII